MKTYKTNLPPGVREQDLWQEIEDIEDEHDRAVEREKHDERMSDK